MVARAGGPVDCPDCVHGVLTTAPLALRQRAQVLTTAVTVAVLGAYSLLGYGGYHGLPNGGIGMLVGCAPWPR